ncbi:MAG: beta-propeller domain-containing protein [Deltaproteobacteria bacterium]|nr:beta-propeller domain-containing protein [Deltaproteobacteria bacterium]
MMYYARRMTTTLIGIALCMCLMLLSGCTGDTESADSAASPATFSSSVELESYLREELSSNVVPRNTIDLAAAEGDFQGGSYSSTNIQEPGVDESDVVKTDGEYLYIARGTEVAIVDAVPADGTLVVSRIDTGGAVDSLYLYGNLLILFTIPEGTWWTTGPDELIILGMPYWISTQAKTTVLMYDISDPANPEKRREVEIEGNLVSSRIVAGKLHVVLQFMPEIPAIDVVYDGTAGDQTATIESNSSALDTLTLEDLVPSYTVTDEEGQEGKEEFLVTYDNFYRPSSPAGGSIITITTFHLDEETLPFESIGFVADAHVVYASDRALYLISNSYACADDGCDSSTVIHKISFADTSDIAAGSVPGWIVNQFSLGEYEDVLRIATTDYTEDFSGFINHVFCMKAEGGELAIIGRIDDITPGEKIYSARFIGERGYLVTFVQVDPLITLDLSDPTSPAIAGELILPGYSTYIHPVDDTALVTLGMNTVLEEGFILNDGVQLSLFDVSDFANPALTGRVTIGDAGTDSEALWNHRAFTFFTGTNLIAFPVDLFEVSGGEDPWTGVYSFSGLYVYRLQAGEGFDYLGRISTAAGEEFFYSYWTRGIFIGDSVYAVNTDAVRSADVADIEHTIRTLDLEE